MLMSSAKTMTLSRSFLKASIATVKSRADMISVFPISRMSPGLTSTTRFSSAMLHSLKRIAHPCASLADALGITHRDGPVFVDQTETAIGSTSVAGTSNSPFQTPSMNASHSARVKVSILVPRTMTNMSPSYTAP